MSPSEIIQREFRQAAGLALECEITVEVDDEADEIRVVCDGRTWVHIMGGEYETGDCFMFEDADGNVVDFDVPEDWEQ